MPLWARTVVAVAGAKAAFGIIAFLAGFVPTDRSTVVPAWVYALVSLAYLAVGGVLVIANRRDVRAAWLGALFVLISAPLSPIVNERPPVLPLWLTYLRPEAFLPAVLFRFVIAFPASPSPRVVRVFTGLSALFAVLAVMLLVINLSVAWPHQSGVVDAAAGLRPWVFSSTNGNYYWPLVFGATLLAMPAVWWRGTQARADERRRVRRFISAFVLGLTPFAIEVLIEELVPSYKGFVSRPTVKPWVAIVLFLPLALVPFATAYSVFFDAVVDLRIVLRAALQHALARYTAIAATIVPFVALAAFVVSHPREPVIALLAGPRPLLLGSAALLGLVALSQRRRWLDAVDRRYFREAYDAQQILTRAVEGVTLESPAETATRVRDALEVSLHADVSIFVLNEAGTSLRDAHGDRPPLSVDTALVGLLLGDTRPMDIELAPGSMLWRLSEHERQWLRQGDYRLLVALRRAGGGANGMIALGPKRSGLPYSTRDRHLVSALAATTALALENVRLRTPITPRIEPAARECLECSRLNPPDATQCGCGGSVVEAAAPHLLRGIFRLEHRIGAGGMGVVYRAIDLTLGRPVAIKTLPRVDADGATRLHREARAMAMLTHPHLAVIHGLETWQGIPFVVEEYLGGGTLAARISSNPPSLAESLDLACTLAAALADLHAAGIIHCDIKPSNIGFTSSGVVKLLDFGLAQLVRGVVLSSDASTVSADSSGHRSALTVSVWRGTPYYMSPEAAHGAAPTVSFDLWSLTVVLFELIARRRPFEGRDADEIFGGFHGPTPQVSADPSAVAPALQLLFDRALAADPVARYQTARDLNRALVALRSHAELQ